MMKGIIKRPIALAVATLAVVAALATMTPLFDFWFRWSPINCRYEEVDIATGRLRFTRYCLYRKVSEEIRPSALSACLPEEVIASATPQWHRVNTFSPGLNHSPHHAFHGAIFQIQELERIWNDREFYGFPDELRRQSAQHVLALWRFSLDDGLACKYIRALAKISDPDDRTRILSALPNLNMPLTESRDDRATVTVFYPDGSPMRRIDGHLDAAGKHVGDGVCHDFPEDPPPDGMREMEK